MMDDAPARKPRDGYEEDNGNYRSHPAGFKWKGEKHQFTMWYKMIQSTCKTKKGLVRRIVCHGLTLDDYLDGADNDEAVELTDDYELANTWIYQLIGRPLFNYEGSTAYSLFNSHPSGEGIEVLDDFKVFFDGNTAEEREDIEDEWRALSFQTDGVTGLATYLGMHKSYVDRLNDADG